MQGWPGDEVRIRDWERARDLACWIGGPNPAMRDDQPYSQKDYERVCAAFGDAAVLDRYETIFVDSITVAVAHLPAVVQGPAAGDLGPERQAGPARRLRAARPGDDRLADPSPAHAAQEHLAGRPPRPAARRLQQALLRHAGRGLEDRPRAARDRRRGDHAGRGPPEDGAPFRAFVCTTINDFGFPAKDRSGRLAMLEPAAPRPADGQDPRPAPGPARGPPRLRPAGRGRRQPPSRRLEPNPWPTTWTSTAPTARTPPST